MSRYTKQNRVTLNGQVWNLDIKKTSPFTYRAVVSFPYGSEAPKFDKSKTIFMFHQEVLPASDGRKWTTQLKSGEDGGLGMRCTANTLLETALQYFTSLSFYEHTPFLVG